MSEAPTFTKGQSINSYYIGFAATGCDAIDNVLYRIARAAELHHHTDGWSEEPDEDCASPLELIQQAAFDAAERITIAEGTVAHQNETLLMQNKRINELRGWLDEEGLYLLLARIDELEAELSKAQELLVEQEAEALEDYIMVGHPNRKRHPMSETRGTTIATIHWTVTDRVDPTLIERCIDETVADLMERLGDVVDEADPKQGMSASAFVDNYRRESDTP